MNLAMRRLMELTSLMMMTMMLMTMMMIVIMMIMMMMIRDDNDGDDDDNDNMKKVDNASTLMMMKTDVKKPLKNGISINPFILYLIGNNPLRVSLMRSFWKP